MDLPLLDVQTVTVRAPVSDLWPSLLRAVAGAFTGVVPSRYAVAIRCEPSVEAGEFAAPASTLPGFRVLVHRPHERLELAGQHAFSTYRLCFDAVPAAADSTELRASSHAVFPGVHGCAYRAAVVSSGVHGLAVRHLLRAVRRDVAVRAAHRCGEHGSAR